MTTKQLKYETIILVAVLLVGLLFTGAGAAIGGIPCEITTDTSYNVLVIDDTTGSIDDTGTPASLVSQYGATKAYLLEDADDWNAVALDESTYNGAILILGDNLNFTGTDSNMMTYPFTGKIFGNGYLMEKFTNTSNTEARIGLIREAGDGLYLNYLQMTNCSLDTEGNDDSEGQIGTLIGYIPTDTHATIIGCAVIGGSCTITTPDVASVGGLVGFADENCQLIMKHSKVLNTSIESIEGYQAGGLISFVSGGITIVNCTIEDCWIGCSGGNLGGLIGYLYHTSANDAEITDCKVIRCTLRSSSPSESGIGGLIGIVENGIISVTDCTVTFCNITGGYSIGGLIGIVENGIISVTEGNVTYSNVTSTKASSYSNVGGLVGKIGAVIEGNSCYVLHCNINGKDGSTTGGLVGKNESGGTFTNCYGGIPGSSDTALFVSSGYPILGSDSGIPPGWTGCDNETLHTPEWTDITMPTKEQIAIFPSVKLPYIYVLYESNASTDASIGSPYSPEKRNVSIPYSRSNPELFDATRLTPVRSGYAFHHTWNDNSGTPRGASPAVTANEVVYASWPSDSLLYVEVETWEELVAAVIEWTDMANMRTIVLTNDTTGAYRNSTGGTNYGGIPTTGNITIKPSSTVAGEIVIDANQKGRLFKVEGGGSLTLAGNGTTVTLNLTGGYISGDSGGGISIERGNLTLKSGTKITNCRIDSANSGGAVNVYDDGTFTMNGGSITDCYADGGGGVNIQSGTFILTGGSISTCNATTGHGGAVRISSNGMCNVSGNPTITGNTRNGSATDNLYLATPDRLNLSGTFSGSVGISVDGQTPAVGLKFGNVTADGAISGGRFVADGNAKYLGSVSGTELVWRDSTPAAPPSGGGSARQTGYTVILPETVASTASPTQAPSTVPTVSPVDPTTLPTQKSPVPAIGLIVGLGAAGFLMKRRE